MWRLALLVGLAAGWLTGGSLNNLAQEQLKGLWAIFLSAALQVSISCVDHASALAQIAPSVHLLSYLPLLWALWANRRTRGMRLLFVGSLLNFAVIGANAGRMPVDPEALIRMGEEGARQILESGSSLTHQLATQETLLAFLSDCYLFPDLYILPHSIFSIGDGFMAVGLVILLWGLMQPETAGV